ncbi:MAG: replicative DNA helicase [Clostridia bacterium]|nr:replicative DNA helicase [Clostridia bacterium]
MADGLTMPASLEAEQSLLGCMIIDNDICVDVLESLDEIDFYQQSHKYILECMKEIYAERKPVDLVTLSDKMETKQYLDKCGGMEYLTEIASSIPTAANFRHYFDIVRRDSTNRALIRAAGEIQKNAMTVDDAESNIAAAEKLVYDISETRDTSTMKDIRTSGGVAEVMDKFQLIHNDKNALKGVMSGFSGLDRLTNGFQKGDLIVIAARPGMGKTSLSMNIVENAITGSQKAVCVVFSLEMPQIQILQRLVCSNAHVSMKKALAGELLPEDWKNLAKAQARLEECSLFIDDSSRMTPAEVLSKCRRIKASEKRLDLVMVDYIQLMTPGANYRLTENRSEEVGRITRELKIIAKELDVPILALSQLRRIEGNKEPQLSDLRESGAIEQDADIVMFINRPDVNLSAKELADSVASGAVVKDEAQLKIAKHRNGETGTVKLHFNGEFTQFVSAATSTEEDYASSKFSSAKSKSDAAPKNFDDDNTPF